ncbi:hypothetical protein ACQKJC_08710 [Priestia koreensis]|uniref:hypothetical protein n=1 Tax=Priestia koreensis TaxID=284581 RepID=UPI003CFCB343
MFGEMKTFFDTYAEHRRNHRPSSYYSYLEKTSNFHGYDDLRWLQQGADTREKKEVLYGYLEKHELNDPQYKRFYSMYEELGEDLGYIKKEEYVSIPKSLILDYMKEMVEDDDSDWYRANFYKHSLNGKEGTSR